MHLYSMHTVALLVGLLSGGVFLLSREVIGGSETMVVKFYGKVQVNFLATSSNCSALGGCLTSRTKKDLEW